MFGLNPIRKIERAPSDGMLAVQEVFYTIQGEGPFSGQPAVFIRLAGCHLACTFCDTEFESGINNRMTVGAIVALAKSVCEEAANQLPRLVVITGGEPMRQDLGPLVGKLLTTPDFPGNFRRVQIETAGNIWDPTLNDFTYMFGDLNLVLVCSPKTKNVHPMVARYCGHYKYVVCDGDEDPEDGLPYKPTQKHAPDGLYRPWSSEAWAPASDSPVIWVSPMDEHDKELNAQNVAHAVKIAMKYDYRLSLQTHKLLNLP